MDKSMLGDLDVLPEEDKLRMTVMIDQLQIRDRLKEFMSHSTESVGSNNTSQKHIIGKRKRETESSASSKIMANKHCPAVLYDDHFTVSMAVALRRLAHKNNIDEIVSLKGKAYWDEITKIANGGTDYFRPVRVIALAKEILEFHQDHTCECHGKALCGDLILCEVPKFHDSEEIAKWYGGDSGNSCVTGMPSSSKRPRLSVGGVSSSLNLEMLPRQESPDRDPPPYMSMHSQYDDGVKLEEIFTRYNIDGKLKDMLLAFLKCPAVVHPVVNGSEDDLLGFLEKISPKEYAKWLKSVMP